MSIPALVLYLLLLGVMIGAVEWVTSSHHVRRWVCRRFEHAWADDERGRPVTAFRVCVRCGKIGERIP